LFYAADHDYSGTINQKELNHIFKKLNISVSRQEFKHILKEAVDNKNGSISFENFMKVFSALVSPSGGK